MKKDILILVALIAVVIAVPFLATKAEEAIQIKNEEFKEKQNRECYEKAEESMAKIVSFGGEMPKEKMRCLG